MGDERKCSPLLLGCRSMWYALYSGKKCNVLNNFENTQEKIKHPEYSCQTPILIGTMVILLKWQMLPWSCVYLCVMQETVIPLSPQHQPQASHCKCELLVHYPHKSLEGEGRKLLHITTPVRLFLMAASRLWPDQVWHMLQWRLTGRQTQRDIRGAMALKQSIVKGNPTLPLTLRQLSPNKI